MLEQRNILHDERDIRRLITGFVYRDKCMWDEFLDLFWEGAPMSISWFDGSIELFVRQSREMPKNGDITTRHLIGQSILNCVGDRAIGETDVSVLIRTRIGDGGPFVDITSWARFVDRFEHRDGHWKIARRWAVYEKDRCDPVVPGQEVPWKISADAAERFPSAYRYLAMFLHELGRSDMKSLIVTGSADEDDLLTKQREWLMQK